MAKKILVFERTNNGGKTDGQMEQGAEPELITGRVCEKDNVCVLTLPPEVDNPVDFLIAAASKLGVSAIRCNNHPGDIRHRPDGGWKVPPHLTVRVTDPRSSM